MLSAFYFNKDVSLINTFLVRQRSQTESIHFHQSLHGCSFFFKWFSGFDKGLQSPKLQVKTTIKTNFFHILLGPVGSGKKFWSHRLWFEPWQRLFSSNFNQKKNQKSTNFPETIWELRRTNLLRQNPFMKSNKSRSSEFKYKHLVNSLKFYNNN